MMRLATKSERALVIDKMWRMSGAYRLARLAFLLGMLAGVILARLVP